MTSTQTEKLSGGIPVSTVFRKSMSAVHLDTIRGSAAAGVFLSHLRALYFIDYEGVTHKGLAVKLFYYLTGLGHEAVMVFFVLSGYFISTSIFKDIRLNRWSWGKYGLNRLTRLYVVLIPALLLGAFWDRVGINSFGSAGVYGGIPEYRFIIQSPVLQHLNLITFLGNLSFLQGILTGTFGSNGALWSLSYEFWYYVFFPLIALAILERKVTRNRFVNVFLLFLIGAWIYLHNKDILLYFGIWLMGFAVSVKPAPKYSVRVWHIVFALGLFLLSLIIARSHNLASPFLSDFLTGVAFALFIYMILHGSKHHVNDSSSIYMRVSGCLSNVSYTLYLTHLPVLVFLNACLIRNQPRWQPDLSGFSECLLVVALTSIYVFVVWWLTEARTQAVRRNLSHHFHLLR